MTPKEWPRRPRLVAGNWKMNLTVNEGTAMVRELVELMRARPDCEVAICPAFPALDAVGRVLAPSGIHLGAQNLHAEPNGAFTGEVAGTMLAGVGCRFVIIGHSERRHVMGEDDATVALKLRAAHRDGLTPIVCVGETLDEREGDKTAEVLVRQIEAAYADLPAGSAEATVVAYEPVWAIGTGRVATPAQAREAHRIIRATLDRVVGEGTGERLAVLYGGSVKADNAADLFAENEVDGALVGGASLKADGLWKIAVAAASA